VILYYALGGGLGHLTRAAAVIHTLGLAEPVVLVSASAFASDARVVGPRVVERPPNALARDPVKLRRWLESLLHRYRPQHVYVDAFPGGIIGEWCAISLPPDTRLHHVSRLLRWERYQRRLCGAMPRFARVHLTEPLQARHEKHLAVHAAEVASLELDYAFPDEVNHAPGAVLDSFARPLWLVVHAGPAAECLNLLRYAAQASTLEGVKPTLILISPQRPSRLPAGVYHLDAYPARRLFPFADCVVSACGFNIMHEAGVLARRHLYVPFERPLDDQFKRAARYRTM